MLAEVESFMGPVFQPGHPGPNREPSAVPHPVRTGRVREGPAGQLRAGSGPARGPDPEEDTTRRCP
ncbi:hypothetical protein GCM10010515_14650 [Streptomyces fructofermentans]|uniref:Uncharacterized protein n=1 Tax=Streptomyces fructofermentans TaxID=152141 RepID=A0A918K4H4_9ACTN|nr:hypothetical protein GCM10010515_14650 [Streptomyces fructofermentans]